MKRVVWIIPALLALTVTVRAAVLPESLTNALPEGLPEATNGGELLSGGVSWLAERARSVLDDALRDGARSAALLVLTALLCGAAEGLADGAGAAAVRYVPFCGVLAAASLATRDLHTLLGLGTQTVGELGTLAKLLLPTLAASIAAGGFVSTASVWQVTTLMVCDALCEAAENLLLPLTFCHAAASAAASALDEERLGALADGLKELVTGALKAATAAFAAYLTVAGVLTGSADRAAVKAAKAAVSGAIPVVGGALSDVAESALAAAGAMRGTVGALGIFSILALCLTPLLRLGVQFLLYKLAAFASGLVGTKALGSFLERLGEAFALVFATTAACALVLLVALLVAASMSMG